jgi:hypothetical protein
MAVILDLMEPIRAGGYGVGRGGDAKIKSLNLRSLGEPADAFALELAQIAKLSHCRLAASTNLRIEAGTSSNST